MFLGSAAFAQVSKTDSTNKTASRKVVAEDVKNLPEDNSKPNAKEGDIKGSVTQKGREGKVTTTEKQHYTVKLTNANNSKVAADSAAQKKAKAATQSDTFIKTPSPRK